MNEQEIKQKLQEKFSPSHLELIDKSHTHTSDQHVETMKVREKLYELILVSESFNEMSLVKRHQAIYQVLTPAFNQTIHGITINAYSPDEWEKKRKN